MESGAPSQQAASADECVRIINSIATLASSVEFLISELIQCKAASVDHERAQLVLAKLVPLQKRLQRMHSKLLEFGRRLPIPPEITRRDINLLSQQLGAAAPFDLRIVQDRTIDERTSSPVRRVAILTFGRWTRKSTEVLQRAGLIKDRGLYGCHYVVQLLPFQKGYLEQIRRLCLYHVVTEEHRIAEVVTIVGTLSCAERGRMKRQEMVDLPIFEGQEMPHEQAAPSGASASSSAPVPHGQAAPSGACASSSAPADPSIWAAPAAYASGNVYHRNDDWRPVDPSQEGFGFDLELAARTGFDQPPPPYYGNADSAGPDGRAWDVVGYLSF